MRIGDWCSDVCSSDLFVQRVVLEADETVERQAVACQAEHAAKFVHIYGARASRGYGLRLQAIEPLMQWRVVDAGKNGLYLYLDADQPGHPFVIEFGRAHCFNGAEKHRVAARQSAVDDAPGRLDDCVQGNVKIGRASGRERVCQYV